METIKHPTAEEIIADKINDAEIAEQIGGAVPVFQQDEAEKLGAFEENALT